MALAVAAGCTLLSDPGAPRCVIVDGTDPCAARGEQCVNGRCQSGECSAERCDGTDNDCDSKVDEGHDEDLDGFSWCGGGVLALRDCDDRDATVYPGDAVDGADPGVELCDGKDNDCDSTVDEEATEALCENGMQCLAGACVNPQDCVDGVPCPEGERCDIERDPPACVAGGCTSASCTGEEECDPVTRNCLVPEPIGTSCVVHGQCESGYCAPTAALGLSGTDKVCSTACCADTDCADGFLCWVATTGARLCVSPDTVDVASGDGSAGDNCDLDSECRSGVCHNSTCVGACALKDDCETGRVCSLVGPFERTTETVSEFSCRGARGSRDTWDLCSTDRECESNLCGGLSGFNVCWQSCGQTADCPSYFFSTADVYCGSAVLEEDSGGRSGRIQACLPHLHDGSNRTGGSCATNEECRDFGCIGGVCADTCCHDDHCPEATRCRATGSGAEWSMRCLP